MERSTARRISIAILALGMAAALSVWIVAEPAAANPLGYDPLTNKKYLNELRLYGGRANVFAAEIMDWFNGLWHGRNLGYTIAVLSAAAAWAFWFFATLPKLDEKDAGAGRAKG